MNRITTAKIVGYSIAGIAAVSSFGHQVELLASAQLDPLFGIVPAEWVTPTTVDSLAIIALIVRGAPEATKAMRRAALLPLVLAGGLSIAANVAVAHTLVGIIVGIWTVLSYLLAELFVSRLERPAPHAPAAAPVSPGMAALVVDAPEEVAYRQAAAELRRTSKLPALNG
jgi:hypothetical protein